MRTILLYFATLFLFSFNLVTQDKNGNKLNSIYEKIEIPTEVTKLCDDFFIKQINGEFEDAFKEFFKSSPFSNKEEQLQRLISEAKRANKTYGELKSYELAKYKAVTPSFLKLYYLAYHANIPMRWVFTFYKSPVHGWMLINVKYDDQTESLFDENNNYGD